MAYNTKFRIEASTTQGDIQVDLQKFGYSGSVVDLVPTDTPFELFYGQQNNNNPQSPLMISDAKISFVGDSAGEQVKEVFNAGDLDFRVQFFKDGNLHWQGYIATDTWQANPYTDFEEITIEAIDGLVLLENRDQLNQLNDNFASNFRGILRGDLDVQEYVGTSLDGQDFTDDTGLHDLPIKTNMNWFSPDLSVQAGANTFNEAYIRSTVYKNLNDAGEAESNLSQREQLEDMLQRFGCVLYQWAGEWHIMQRSSIDHTTGETSVWTMPVGSMSFGNKTTVDLSGDMPTEFQQKTPQRSVLRTRSITSTFNLKELNNLISNPGFESGLSSWDVSTTSSGAAQINVNIGNYDTFGVSRNSTQQNVNVLSLEHQDVSSTGQETYDGSASATINQTGFSPIEPADGSTIEISFDASGNKVEVPGRIAQTDFLRVDVGDFTLDAIKMNVTDSAEASGSSTGTINVDNPYAANTSNALLIPEGAELLIIDPTESVASLDTFAEVTTITVAKNFYTSSNTLVGEFDADIPVDAQIIFYQWVGISEPSIFQNDLPVRTSGDNTNIKEVTLLLPLETPGGIRVSGVPKIQFFVDIDYQDVANPSNMTLNYYLDNVSVKIKDGADKIETLSYSLVNPDIYGEEVDVEHFIGDAPTLNHPKSIDDIFNNNFDTTSIWQIGSGPASVEEKSLDRLYAEEWMRQYRNTLKRYTTELALQEGSSFPLTGVYDVNGDTYTVSFARFQYVSGGTTRAKVELTELRRDGLSGLQGGQFASGPDTTENVVSRQKTTFSTQPVTITTGGNKSFSIIGSQTIEGASSWSDLSTKPSNLFARNADTDGYAETVVLADTDITDALGYTPLGDGERADNLNAGQVYIGDANKANTVWPLSVRVSDGSAYSPSGVGQYITQFCYTDNASVGHSLNIGFSNANQKDGIILKADTDAAGESGVLKIGNSLSRPQIVVDETGDVLLEGNNKTSVFNTFEFNDTLQTPGATTGFTGSGTYLSQNKNWVDNLNVRGTLLAFEFEARKITVSRGPLMIGPGGGKLDSVNETQPGEYTLTFAENPGIAAGDLLLIQEIDTSGTSQTIVKEVFLRAISDDGGKSVDATLEPDSTGVPVRGDDVAVIGSTITSRDSSLYLDPYGPNMDVLDGISTVSDWQNRTPQIRLGKLDGFNLQDGTALSGMGMYALDNFYADNAYLRGEIVAETGSISDSVTVGAYAASDLAGLQDVDEGKQLVYREQSLDLKAPGAIPINATKAGSLKQNFYLPDTNGEVTIRLTIKDAESGMRAQVNDGQVFSPAGPNNETVTYEYTIPGSDLNVGTNRLYLWVTNTDTVTVEAVEILKSRSSTTLVQSSENILRDGSHETHVDTDNTGFVHIYRSPILNDVYGLLDEYGLSVGEQINFSAEVRTLGSQQVRLWVEFFDENGDRIQLFASLNQTTGAEWIRDNISARIPQGTERIRIAVDNENVPAGDETDIQCRKAQLTRGWALVPYSRYRIQGASSSDFTRIDGGFIQTGTVDANRIIAGSITSDRLAANSVTANKIQVGSVQDIDADAALLSDVFSGNLSDLNGAGDLAALNEIDDVTLIAPGIITTDRLAADAAAISDLFAGTVTVDDRLLLGTGGDFTNPNTDFLIDQLGIQLLTGPNNTRSIRWYENGYTGGIKGLISTEQTGFGGSDDLLRLFGEDGITFDTPQTVFAQNGSGNNMRVEPFIDDGDFNQQIRAHAIIWNPYSHTGNRPTDDDIRNNLSPGEAMIMPVRFSDGNINMMYAARRGDDTVEVDYMGT